MKLIIAGSRSITDSDIVRKGIKESSFDMENVDEIIHGDSDEGVDSLVNSVVPDSKEINTFPYQEFMDEAPHPKVAPLIRNEEMAKRGDALLAIWDGESSGTENMIENAKENDLEIYIHRTNTTLFDF